MDEDEFYKLKLKCTALQSELQEADLHGRNLQLQLNEVKGALRGAERTIEDKEDQVNDLRQELTNVRNENVNLKDQLDTLMETKLNERGSMTLTASMVNRIGQYQEIERGVQTELTVEDMEEEAARVDLRETSMGDEISRLKAIIEEKMLDEETPNSRDGSEVSTPFGLEGSGPPRMPMLSLNLAQQQSQNYGGVNTAREEPSYRDDNSSFDPSHRAFSGDGITPRVRGYPMSSSRCVSETRRSDASPPGDAYRPTETPRVTMVLPPSLNQNNQRVGATVPTMVTGEQLVTPRLTAPMALSANANTAAASQMFFDPSSGSQSARGPPPSDGHKHIFDIDENAEDAEGCPVCDLMEQVQRKFAGKMVDRQAYYAVGWIPEMCSRWQAEHFYAWTIEERAAMANMLTSRPTLSTFPAAKVEGPVYLWRSRVFWKSPWKQCFGLLQGVFLYIFNSRDPDEKLLAVTLVRNAKIQSCQADGKDYCLKITSLCCRNCISASESDSTELMTLAFDNKDTASNWSRALLEAQSTCPHRCSSKFQNELGPFREIIEFLLNDSLLKKVA